MKLVKEGLAALAFGLVATCAQAEDIPLIAKAYINHECSTVIDYRVEGLNKAAGGLLNVRSGPGPEFEVQGQLREGFVISGCPGIRNWIKIEKGPGTGSWVSPRYLIAQSTPHKYFKQPAAPQRQATRPTQITLTSAQIAALHEGVRTSLKDPNSAMFSGPTYAVRQGDEITACGMVNAKNSYGGYVGAGPYIAKMRNDVVFDSATASRDADILIGMCREAGIQF